jgi:hypothetical protein
MRVAGEMIGPRGAALLAVTGVAGLLLGIHGWAGRHHGLPSSSLAGGPRPAATQPASTATPSTTPSSTPSAGPSQGPTKARTPKPGPKLSSQSYASYSFQVWPGAPSTTAKAAETGLAVTVHRQGGGINVAAGIAGQALPAPTYYPTGTKVYIVEASMGDDSGGADYNLGDDALLVTDAQGRILQ